MNQVLKNEITIKEGVPTLLVNSPLELKNFMLIDVRRPDEFNGELGHIDGAQLVTLGPDLDLFLNEKSKSGQFNQKILFICRSGVRSANATIKAMQLGFKEVYNMEGGMIAWNEKKFETSKS